jgi:hypothetical protein
MRWRFGLPGWHAAPAILGAIAAFSLLVPNFVRAQAEPAADAPPAQNGASFPKGHYGELDALPDWGGIWFLNRRPSAEAPPPMPRLKAEYLERREQWRQEALANNGVVRRNRSNCSPPGMPRIMQLAQYPYEFLFTPGRVTINQEAWMQTRTIWTDGRAHPEDPDPTFMGHSIGRWEGETLVVDTIGILEDLEFASGALHSPEFRLTERIRLSAEDPDILINEIRMEDPLALAEPYEVTVTYRRDRESSLIEFQCSENDRNPVNAEGLTEFD